MCNTPRRGLADACPALPKQKKCACGASYYDYAQAKGGGWNVKPHKRCKSCHIKRRKAATAAAKRTAAVETSGYSPPNSPPPPETGRTIVPAPARCQVN